MALRRDGNSIAIAICSDVTVVEIEGTSEGANGPEVFWRASGELAVARGEVLDVSRISEGLAFSIESAVVSTDRSITIYVTSARTGLFGIFHIRGPLSDESWLQSDGSSSAAACPELE